MGNSPQPARNERKYDLVVWGATGFTGQLVAGYLTQKYGVGRGLSWALGGRSRAKLEEVRGRLAAIDPAARDLPIITGDCDDRASLDALVRDTRVVLTTVGPYSLYGVELVAACVAAGTDYCDLAGETPFIRESIERHHAGTQARGTKIVHCCGYDSIPSDLGTLFTQETMRARHGVPCAEVKCFAGESRGGLSGGTVASMLNLMDTASRDRRVRRILGDPYSLDPGHERGPDGPDPMGVRFDADIGRWTGPFMMAAINSRVVRRSNALLGYAWGRDFRYTEAMSFKSGPAGLATAAAMSAGVVGAFGAMAVAPVRRWAARSILPKPGEGPSEKLRESGFFVHRLVGTSAGTSAGSAPSKVLVTVKGKGDPGYSATARMLAESAVCLALDSASLPATAGVLTPAAAMGMTLVDRLRKVDFSFEAAAS